MASSTCGFDIAKAGWLYRQSSVLRRWKRNWFVLDRDGDLRYFESQDTPSAIERLVVRAVVKAIKSGPDCTRADPPEGVSTAKACYLELLYTDGQSMLLCAESFDDMKAWQISLEEARVQRGPACPPPLTTLPPHTPYGYSYVGYGQYPGQVISTPGIPGASTQIIHGTGGTTTTIVNGQPQQVVYVDNDPYYYRRRRGYYGNRGYVMPFFFF